MTVRIETAPTANDVDLERATQRLTTISSELLQGYRTLEERALRVERELSRTNAELEAKIAELDRVSSHLEAVLGALPTGVVVRDADGDLLRANPAALRLMGVPAEDLRTHDACGELPGLEGAAATGVPRPVQCADGARRVLATRWSAVTGADGEAVGSVELLDDHTEVTALAERLHGLDKLAALGNMAGGIAHEIRNPLNAIKGFAALLARELEEGSKHRRWSETIVAGSTEVDAILSSMLSLATPEQLQLETIQPRALAEDAVRLARPAGTGGRISIEVRTDGRSFAGDRIKLRQALRNLIANALEAQSGSGRVRVEITSAADAVTLCVSDAGPGIADDVRGRVFDPFFTTRPEGTGLGLALVATIARLHGGGVELGAERSPLGGAEVRLRLPLTEQTTERS
jgi:signal transduction histidine kinase